MESDELSFAWRATEQRLDLDETVAHEIVGVDSKTFVLPSPRTTLRETGFVTVADTAGIGRESHLGGNPNMVLLATNLLSGERSPLEPYSRRVLRVRVGSTARRVNDQETGLSTFSSEVVDSIDVPLNLLARSDTMVGVPRIDDDHDSFRFGGAQNQVLRVERVLVSP